MPACIYCYLYVVVPAFVPLYRSLHPHYCHIYCHLPFPHLYLPTYTCTTIPSPPHMVLHHHLPVVHIFTFLPFSSTYNLLPTRLLVFVFVFVLGQVLTCLLTSPLHLYTHTPPPACLLLLPAHTMPGCLPPPPHLPAFACHYTIPSAFFICLPVSARCMGYTCICLLALPACPFYHTAFLYLICLVPCIAYLWFPFLSFVSCLPFFFLVFSFSYTGSHTCLPAVASLPLPACRFNPSACVPHAYLFTHYLRSPFPFFLFICITHHHAYHGSIHTWFFYVPPIFYHHHHTHMVGGSGHCPLPATCLCTLHTHHIWFLPLYTCICYLYTLHTHVPLYLLMPLVLHGLVGWDLDICGMGGWWWFFAPASFLPFTYCHPCLSPPHSTTYLHTCIPPHHLSHHWTGWWQGHSHTHSSCLYIPVAFPAHTRAHTPVPCLYTPCGLLVYCAFSSSVHSTIPHPPSPLFCVSFPFAVILYRSLALFLPPYLSSCLVLLFSATCPSILHCFSLYIPYTPFPTIYFLLPTIPAHHGLYFPCYYHGSHTHTYLRSLLCLAACCCIWFGAFANKLPPAACTHAAFANTPPAAHHHMPLPHPAKRSTPPTSILLMLSHGTLMPVHTRISACVHFLPSVLACLPCTPVPWLFYTLCGMPFPTSLHHTGSYLCLTVWRYSAFIQRFCLCLVPLPLLLPLSSPCLYMPFSSCCCGSSYYAFHVCTHTHGLYAL